MIRTISPSEMTDFAFCQKYWYNKRKLNLVSRKISHRDLAAMMGQSVGWSIDNTFKGIMNKSPWDFFQSLLDEQLGLGREYDFGVDEGKVKEAKQKVTEHIDNLWEHKDLWLGKGTVIASEPIMEDWGLARQDIVIEEYTGSGTVADFKCKYSDKEVSFAKSRDVDLYGNQAMLYPIAWNSLNHPVKITKVRFIYSVIGKPPIIEEVVCQQLRQEKWLQSYYNTVAQINMLELTPETIHDRLLENPYHQTPWGACEFREFCSQGEHGQAGLGEFIQVERKKK